MTGHAELPATSLLITDLGNRTYRLTFQNDRHYVAVRADAGLLQRWAAEMRDAAAGAPPPLPRRPCPHVGGPNTPGPNPPGTGSQQP